MRRDRSVLAMTGAFGAFAIYENGSWIAVTILAHGAGGLNEAAIVMGVQLVPAAVAAVFVGTWMQRWSAVSVLRVGFVAQAMALVAAGLLVAADAPRLLVYVVAVVAAVAVVTTRPAIATALPSLVTEPRALISANVMLGWLMSVGMLLGPAFTAVAIAWSGIAAAFLVHGGLALSAALCATVVARPPSADVVESARPVGFDELETTALRPALREIRRSSGPIPALAVVSARSLVIGSLDLLVVIVAVDVLGAADETAGLFGTAIGVGAVIGGAASALLIGRDRLSPAIALAGVALVLSLVGLAAAPTTAAAALGFAAAGAAATGLVVAGRAILQRVTDLHLLGHVFALAEAGDMTMLLVGTVGLPVVISATGARWAPAGIGIVVLGILAVSLPALVRVEKGFVDAGRLTRLLGANPAFTELPPGALESLVRTAAPRRFDAGTELMRAGDLGDDYHVIVSGEVEIIRDGRVVNRASSPQGVGELALLHDVPRTATVLAVTDVETLAIGADAFLLAVTAYPPIRRPPHWDAGDDGPA